MAPKVAKATWDARAGSFRAWPLAGGGSKGGFATREDAEKWVLDESRPVAVELACGAPDQGAAEPGTSAAAEEATL